MTSATTELVARGVHALRRSAMWWGISIVALALMTVAFWPSLESSDALGDLEGFNEGLLEAFGAQNIATPAGYLDGQLYALMLPLLLSGMAIAGITALTSGDEHGGRLELLHALPVSRRSVWLARLAASMGTLLAVSLGLAVLVAVLLGPFSLEGVAVGRVVGATLACALLAAFHAAVGYAVSGLGASRGAAVGTAVGVLVAGYVLNFLFPLSDSLAGGQKLSPWYWAIGSQPVSDGVRPGWVVLLVAVSAGLVVLGTASLDRRDIRSA